MNYLSIIKASCVDFSGWSSVLQVSGCSNGCKGCFNYYSHNPKHGLLFTEEIYQELKSYLEKPFINNLVIQGGDCLFKTNIEPSIELCRRVKEDLPNKNIVVFTGYTLEQIQNDEKRVDILKHIDYLVDGKYDKTLPSAKFRGSSNQRIIHLIDGKVVNIE